jgi:hypothetical protein
LRKDLGCSFFLGQARVELVAWEWGNGGLERELQGHLRRKGVAD